MTNRQTSKKNMFNKMKVYFKKEENIAVWAGFPRLVQEIDTFINLNKELDKQVRRQQQETKGITIGKDKKFMAMVKLIVKTAGKAWVWANDNNNKELEAVFDIYEADYVEEAEEVAYGKIKNVRDALHENIGSLAVVNILPAHIAAIDMAMAVFRGEQGKPGEARGEKKTGTSFIKQYLKMCNHSLEKIDALLVGEYEESHWEMVMDYKSNRSIDTVGVHKHQGISADITYEDGSKAQWIKMRIVELEKERLSDIDGHVTTLRGKIGTYHIEFSGSEVVTQLIKATIKRATVLNLEVKMRRV